MTDRALAVLSLFVLPALVLAQADRAQTEAAARRNTERIQALQHESDRLAAEEKTLLGDLSRLEVERRLKAEEVRQLDAEAGGIEHELATVSSRAQELQEREMAARPELRARLVEMYKLGSARYLRLLLATTDARRLGEASRALAALAQHDRDRITAHQRTLDELTATRASLEERQRALEALRRDMLAAEAAAARAAKAKNDLIRDIDHQRDLNAQLAGELQAAQQRLQATLREMAAPSAAPAGRPAAAGPEARIDVRAAKGDLDWPLQGTIRRRFDTSVPRRAGASDGIEIAAAEGASAMAISDGVVAYADAFSGFGNLVIVDHGSEIFSVYGNLLDIGVKKGARIDRGQPVGTVGTPPAAPTGAPGLYFELRVDGQAVDPLQWFKKR